MRISSALAAMAVLIVVLAPTASAQGGTEDQRRSWARSQPSVYSHGQMHDHLCPGRAVFRRASGDWANAYGPNEGACSDQFTLFPVHRDGRMVIKTRPEAVAVHLAIIQSRYPFRVRDGRACTRFTPRLWECRMPPPGGEGEAYLTIGYPGARASWRFTFAGHSPDRH
jgi:hypothetical protein